MLKTDQSGLFGLVTGADDSSGPEARNGLRHVASLSMTKLSDGLINPRLVLAWLAQSLGAPAVLVGLLVPIREAGALLPQLLLAGRVQAMRQRKWAWVVGALGQGGAAIGLILAALLLEGRALGLAFCALLAVLALSRAACSVSYKDILGKTVAKTRRGAITGTAGSVASAGVLVFALLLMTGALRETAPLIAALGIAALLWITAAALFSRLEEENSETSASSDSPSIDLAPLRNDPQFRRFIYARGALTVTSLAPPYIVLLDDSGGALQGLGALLLASSAASFLSSYVWGRLADRSSRWVLALAGFAGAGATGLAALAGGLGWTGGAPWVAPGILFALMIAYHGVRQGRSTYLVDMAPEDARASYAALANTIIGGLLLLTGALGGALAWFGPVITLAGFAVLSALGGVLALGLNEVEGES